MFLDEHQSNKNGKFNIELPVVSITVSKV